MRILAPQSSWIRIGRRGSGCAGLILFQLRGIVAGQRGAHLGGESKENKRLMPARLDLRVKGLKKRFRVRCECTARRRPLESKLAMAILCRLLFRAFAGEWLLLRGPGALREIGGRRTLTPRMNGISRFNPIQRHKAASNNEFTACAMTAPKRGGTCGGPSIELR